MVDRAGQPGVDALVEGRAFVDLSPWRKVAVSGGDAHAWLNDLLTADLSGLGPGDACPSLLLSPTGGVRALVHVIVREGDDLLVQDPRQADHIGLLLNPYVLSSDVSLIDATNDLSMFAVPGKGASRVGHPGSSPSVLGQGVDLLVASGKPAWRLEEALARADLEEASSDATETWRIVSGRPLLGVDAELGALPTETGLAHAVSTEKGCYLGQEAVARAINLGHPRRVLRHVTATEGPIHTDERVFSGTTQAGRLTSAAAHDGRWYAFALVAWAAASNVLSLDDGRILVDVPTAG